MRRTNAFTVVVLALLLLLPVALFAGGQSEGAEATEAAATTTAAAGGGEAPILKELVDQGELPTLEERLPEEPMVVSVDEIGVYGGELHYPSTYTFAMDVWIRESLTLFPKGDPQPGPGLAKSWDVSADGKTYTFYLRPGHKWSDGDDFTAEDIRFLWEDMWNYDDYAPYGPPGWMKSGGTDTEFTVIDDYTVQWTFGEPYALFPKVLSFRGVFEFENIASHYLKQFHPKYGDEDQIQQMVDENDYEDWTQLFDAKRNEMDNTELPVLNAWVITQGWPDKRMILERNPYYYKVDQEGNQLPYIDRVVSPYVSNAELARLKVLDGQTDYQYKFMGFTDYTMLKEGEDEGGYKVLQWPSAGGFVGMHMNQNQQDPEKRELFQDARFRKALSHAIDRDEMNDLLMFGVGVPTQVVPAELDPYHIDGSGDTALEFDPDRANQLLDEVGLDQRNSDGYRLLPSGKVLELTIETFEYEIGTPAIEFYQMVTEYWDKVGVKATAKQLSSELWRERCFSGQVEIPGYGSAGLSWDIDPLWYVPTAQSTYWAPLYGLYYSSGGAEGEEPPAEIAQLQSWYDQLTAETDEQERIELGKKIIRQHDENVYMIGILQQPFQPVVVNSKLRNYLEEGVQSYRMLHEAQSWPEQLFYVDGKRK
jgi:peptide/nickel transport system substrate-binding protein